MRDQALAHIDHVVRAMRAQSGHAVSPHRELHPRAPAQAAARWHRRGLIVARPLAARPLSAGRLAAGLLAGRILIARQCLDRDLAVEASQSLELLADDGGLQRSLRGQGHVLPVAATAAAGMRVRARCLDPVGRRLQDLHRVGAGQPGRDLGKPGEHRLTGERMPDEHHRPVLRPGDAPSAVRHVPCGDLDDLTGTIIHHGYGEVTPDFRPGRERRPPPPVC
jgi:hypothetical protein